MAGLGMLVGLFSRAKQTNGFELDYLMSHEAWFDQLCLTSHGQTGNKSPAQR